MKMDSKFQEAFQRLKPLCVKLTLTCSIENIEKLRAECYTLDKVSLQILQEYLIFPIRLALRTQTNEHIIIECLDFLTFVFWQTEVLSWNLFLDVSLQIFRYISSAQSLLNASEELKTAVCDCGEAMTRSASCEILMRVYSKDFQLTLAQYIFSILQLIRREAKKSLRMSAVKVLAAFLCYSESPKYDETVILKAGDRFSTFLPGVSVTLCDVICGDAKQGHAITVLSIRIFGDFVTMTVGDSFVLDIVECVEQVKEDLPYVTRSSAWIETIADKLQTIIQNITRVLSHDHWKVRLALVHLAETILCKCSKNLSNCISSLLQLLFALSVDHYEQVSEESKVAIERFAKQMETVKSLRSILEDDLFNMSGKLIKIQHSTNDCEKLLLLKTIHGYFQLLGKSVSLLLYSLPHLERFVLSALNLVRFDYLDLNSMAKQLPLSDLHDADLQKLWSQHKFLYFQDQQIASRVCLIFELLSLNADSYILIDYLLEQHNAHYRNESVFLIISVLKGLGHKTYPIKEDSNNLHEKRGHLDCINHIVSLVFDFLLSSDSWKVPFGSRHNTSTPDKHKENMLQAVLILECIATCSYILKADFSPFLKEVLCPVMEKAGCSNFLISHSGKLTLHSLAHYCNYESIASLVTSNADYLINSIMTQLHYFSCQPETLIVLQVATRYCDADILPLLKAPFYEMLRQLDLNQEKALPIMKVLRSVVKACGTWFPGIPSLPNKILQASFKAEYLKRHHLRMIEMSFADTDTTADLLEQVSATTKDAIGNEDQKTELLVDMITEVLKRCVHLMSSRHLELTVLTLELIGASITTLRNDTDKVLPYVHQIWSPLVHRFKENITVSMKAFETLIVIVNECGNFVKARTLKDVWPKFLSFLKSQMVFSANKQNNSDYCVTSTFKYQLIILSEIGNLAKKLELTEREIEMLSLSCLMYLNCAQPDILQNSAKQSLGNMVILDPDALWFHYNELYSTQTCIESSLPNFKPVYFHSHLSNTIGNHNL